MPEVGVSEFRTPGLGKNTSRDAAPGSSESSQSTKTPLVRRLIEAVADHVSFIKPFKPQDYTQRRIAEDILTITRNPLRDRAGLDPYANPFDKRTILSAKGQLRKGLDSPAYRALSQSLAQLAREGAIEAEQTEEEWRGEHTVYRIVDPDRLREIASLQEDNS
ncbi:MAG: hypothetical protein HYW63_02700 [Candidatus Levybacteria bacterium]|nr:hypothetical protein [Candidatus Levybacteria bacterium]